MIQSQPIQSFVWASLFMDLSEPTWYLSFEQCHEPSRSVCVTFNPVKIGAYTDTNRQMHNEDQAIEQKYRPMS